MHAVSVELLFFHPSILEPNFDLAICEVQHSGQLESFLFVDVHAEEKFPFQDSNLVLGIRTPLFPGSLGQCWNGQKKKERGGMAVRATGPIPKTSRPDYYSLENCLLSLPLLPGNFGVVAWKGKEEEQKRKKDFPKFPPLSRCFLRLKSH